MWRRLMLIGLIALSGCADAFLHSYEPTLDKPYADKDKHDKDIAECREWAKLTDRESARVDTVWASIPVVALYGYAQLAVLDKEDRDKDPRRTTSVVNNINVCMERRGYAVNELESHIPGNDYPK